MMLRLACLLAAVTFGVGAVASVASDVRARPVIQFARTVETADTLPALRTDEEVRLLNSLSREGGCGEMAVRGRLTAAIFLFGGAVEKGLPEPEIRERLRLAGEVADTALGCSPFDGNRWYLAGRLRAEQAGNPAGLEPFLLASIDKAPFEGAVMAMRWTYLAPVIAQTGLWRVAAVGRDFDNLLATGDIGLLREVVAVLNATGSAAEVDAALARLPETRRILIAPAPL